MYYINHQLYGTGVTLKVTYSVELLFHQLLSSKLIKVNSISKSSHKCAGTCSNGQRLDSTCDVV